MTRRHHALDYLEYPATDLAATRTFFETVFGWQFTDYGPDYIAFARAGLEGGFYRAPLKSRTESGAALAVFYSDSLEQTQRAVEAAGGIICKPVFAFPGGRRFHFIEPSGNEFAVWSEQA